MILTRFLNKSFRAGTKYELIEWNGASDDDKQLLLKSADAGNIYGLFKPAYPRIDLIPKIAFREPALIYLHCKTHHQLPNYLLSGPFGQTANMIAQMVIDNILELQHEGDYISGAGAAKIIFGVNGLSEDIVTDKLSLLSANAIRYAFFLKNESTQSLANKLYSFNTIPRDKSRQSFFASSTAINEFVFSTFNQTVSLEESWSLNKNRKYWFSWFRSRSASADVYTATGNVYKLYLSPMPDEMPSLFNCAIPAITMSAATSFKIGKTINGLLRPDKMVVYFDNQEDLLSAADTLRTLLRGVGAHGVPFTKQLDEEGLISFGVDHTSLNQKQGYSWRSWVTEMLAKAILQAKAEGLGLEESFDYIKARLFTEKIDVGSWSFMDLDDNC